MQRAAGRGDSRQVLGDAHIVRSEGSALDPTHDKNALPSPIVQHFRSGARLGRGERVDVLRLAVDGEIERTRIRQSHDNIPQCVANPVVSVRDPALESLHGRGVDEAGQALEPRNVFRGQVVRQARHDDRA